MGLYLNFRQAREGNDSAIYHVLLLQVQSSFTLWWFNKILDVGLLKNILPLKKSAWEDGVGAWQPVSGRPDDQLTSMSTCIIHCTSSPGTCKTLVYFRPRIRFSKLLSFTL